MDSCVDDTEEPRSLDEGSAGLLVWLVVLLLTAKADNWEVTAEELTWLEALLLKTEVDNCEVA